MGSPPPVPLPLPPEPEIDAPPVPVAVAPPEPLPDPPVAVVPAGVEPVPLEHPTAPTVATPSAEKSSAAESAVTPTTVFTSVGAFELPVGSSDKQSRARKGKRSAATTSGFASRISTPVPRFR